MLRIFILNVNICKLLVFDVCTIYNNVYHNIIYSKQTLKTYIAKNDYLLKRHHSIKTNYRHKNLPASTLLLSHHQNLKLHL